MFEKQKAFIANMENEIFTNLQQSIEKNADVLKDLILQDQLFIKGEDGNTVKLKGYTRRTIRLKINKGQPVDRTTLKDTGKFYEGVTIIAKPDRLEVTWDVTYGKYLIKHYGKAILQPNIANTNIFIRDYVMKDLRTAFLMLK